MSLFGRIKRRLLGGPANDGGSFGNYGRAFINRDVELPWLQEQIKAYTSVQKVRTTLFQDNFTGETPEMRVAYRKALAEPAVKAALLGKIYAVMALPIKIKPYDTTPLSQEVADFVTHAIEMSDGGVPSLVWEILSGGLIDGYSVCEPVWKDERHGRFKGKKTLKELKSKDSRYIQFELDTYRNITSVISMRGNAGQAFDPSDFIIFQHLSLFKNPFGMSDLRASYRAITMIAAILQLRMIFLDKYTGPYLIGKLKDPTRHQRMMDHLAQARASGYIVLDPGSEVEVMDLASRGTSDFQAAVEDLRQEVAIGISGAFLTMMTGTVAGARGDSGVQQDTVDLFIWLLTVSVAAVLQEQLVPDLVEPNYGTEVGHPIISLEAPNIEEILKSLDVFERVQGLGVEISQEEVRKVANTRPPRDENDKTKQPGDMAAGLPGMDDGGVQAPAPGDDDPFAGDLFDDDSANAEPATFAEEDDEPDVSMGDDTERAELLADVLGGLYGDDSLSVLDNLPATFAEAPKKQGFSGIITDKRGRKRKYENGKPVPTSDEPTSSKSSSEPTSGAEFAKATPEAKAKALKEAWEHQTMFIEHQDGLVTVPRLYHEAEKRMPGLTLADFHKELKRLSNDRTLELHVINETKEAKDLHLAISENDRMYYYARWKPGASQHAELALFAEPGYSGIMTDALGRKRKYENGKQVPLGEQDAEGGDQKAKQKDSGTGEHAQHIAEASDSIVGEMNAEAASKPGLVQKVRDVVAKVYPVMFNVATKVALLAHDVREDVLDTADDYSRITYAKAGRWGTAEHDPMYQSIGLPTSAALGIVTKALAYAVSKLAGKSQHAELDPLDVLIELIRAQHEALGLTDQPEPDREQLAQMLQAKRDARQRA